MSLNEYEVDTVLFNLNEDNLNLRCHIYALFGSTVIKDDHKLLLNLIDRLVCFIYKYKNSKQDRELIFSVMRKLGG